MKGNVIANRNQVRGFLSFRMSIIPRLECVSDFEIRLVTGFLFRGFGRWATRDDHLARTNNTVVEFVTAFEFLDRRSSGGDPQREVVGVPRARLGSNGLADGFNHFHSRAGLRMSSNCLATMHHALQQGRRCSWMFPPPAMARSEIVQPRQIVLGPRARLDTDGVPRLPG